MTVEIWYGRWPETTAEQDALVELYRFLEPQHEHFLVMVQFHAGESNELDWVIVKANYIFVVELKHTRDKLVGGSEGDWQIIREDGSTTVLHTNPFKQVKYGYWRFSDWCENNWNAITEGRDSHWREEYKKKGMRSFIIITPELHPESEIKIPPPTEIMGLSKFMFILMARAYSGLKLSREEIRRIPRLLQLQEWQLVGPVTEEPVSDPGQTVKISPDWKPPPFTGLVALGHETSVPIANFNDVSKDVMTIGREKSSDLAIEDESVSHHHAQIRREENRYVVEDLNSLNGTWVNFKGQTGSTERKLTPNTPNLLKNHSIVRFGKCRYMFLQND